MLISDDIKSNKPVYSTGKFCGFLRGFFKSPLKRRFGTAVPTVDDKLKNADFSAFFVCIISWGFRPKPGHKKLFEKSFLELQKLRQNEVVCLREVLWITFLRGKVIGR